MKKYRIYHCVDPNDGEYFFIKYQVKFLWWTWWTSYDYDDYTEPMKIQSMEQARDIIDYMKKNDEKLGPATVTLIEEI